jgi:polysaccharide export outer membrane protein
MKLGRQLLLLMAALLCVLFTVNVSLGQGYVIGEEDVIQISVWGNPDLTVKVPVKPDGMISVHLIGEVKAAGLTPPELKAVLEKDLSKFMKTPNVSVIVTDVNSFKVFILGEGIATEATTASNTANTPHVMTFKRNTTLIQLLAYLGSLKNADLNAAYIMRDGKKLSNDFYRLVTKGDLSQDIQLKPNDVIFIPDNFAKRITVTGAVKTPNVQHYREGLTVVDAILGAGGFTEYASQNDVLVVRREDNQVKSIEVRAKDVMKDGDINKDVLLKPGDHIIVKTGIF